MRSQGTTTLIKCVIFFSYNVVYSCVWSHYTSTHRGCISFFKDKKKKERKFCVQLQMRNYYNLICELYIYNLVSDFFFF